MHIRITLLSAICAISLLAISTEVVNGQVAQTKSESLLPGTTKGMFVVRDAHALASEIEQTSLGEMVTQREMQKFIESAKVKIETELADKSISIGKFTDFSQVAAGEISLSISAPDDKTTALCLLVETAEEMDTDAAKLIENIGQRLLKRGAKKMKSISVGKSKVQRFDITPKKRVRPGVINSYYATAGNWMIVTNNESVMREVIGKIGGDKTRPSLASVDRFKGAMAKLSGKTEKKSRPHMVWYADPFGIATAIKASAPGKLGKEYLPILKNKIHGLIGIQAAAGEISFNVDDEHEVLTRSYVYAPNLYSLKGAIEALDFRNGGRIDMSPEPWVPNSAGAYSALTIDMSKGFGKIHNLVDSIVGNKDTVKNFIKSIEKEEGVNLETSMINNLGKKIMVVSDPNPDSSKDSERLLICVSIAKNEKAVAKALKAAWKPADRNGEVTFHKFKGIELLEYIPSVANDDGGPEVRIPGAPQIPGLDPPAGAPKKGRKIPALVKSQVYFVANGCIMITNGVDYAKKIISDVKAKNNLSNSPAYNSVMSSLKKWNGDADSLNQFGRLSKLYKSGYKLTRAGKMKESNSILGTIIKELMKKRKEDQKQLFDFKLLPEDYDKFIGPFLGDYGVAVKSENDGWYITGVVKAPREETSVPKK